MRAVRRHRGLSSAQAARLLGVPRRTYQFWEGGQGKIDLEKLDLFARAVNADPFALLLAAQFGSSEFAVRAAGNKAAMVLIIALEQFNADAGDRLAQLDTASLLSAMSEAFRKLLAELEARTDLPGV